MTIRVTIKNEDTREDAVILVKTATNAVEEVAAGQAVTLHVYPGASIEIVERPPKGVPLFAARQPSGDAPESASPDVPAAASTQPPEKRPLAPSPAEAATPPAAAAEAAPAA